MIKKILVTYASRTGTTAGVADAIGKTLADKGMDVDILQMKDVRDLSPYDAVIAGSAIHSAKWLPEAIEFLEKNRAELSEKKFASFMVCMTLAMPNAEKYRQGITEWMAPVRRIIRPLKEGLFAGSLHIAKIPSFSDRLKFRVSLWTGVWKAGDHRDWDAIRKWADELSSLL